MAKASYDACLARLIAHEGGYSNHPSDPGGPTKYGITIADYRRYVKAEATVADVRAMSVDAAKAIYRTRYWNAMRCDDLPAGVDEAVFDYGVNSGVARAGKVLRRVLGLSDRASSITDDVIAAACEIEAGRLVTLICDERLRFLRALKTWPTFGAGWSRRVAEVRASATALSAVRPAVESKPAASVAKGGVAQVAGTSHWMGRWLAALRVWRAQTSKGA